MIPCWFACVWEALFEVARTMVVREGRANAGERVAQMNCGLWIDTAVTRFQLAL